MAIAIPDTSSNQLKLKEFGEKLVRFECSWSYFRTMHWSTSCILRPKATFWSQITLMAIAILTLALDLL